MATAEITIYGAGVLGLSCALACLKRGASVNVIDPNGAASGASGGIVGALAPHTPDNWNPKKQFQFDSLIMTRDFWPWVEAISGMTTGYSPTGRVQPIMTDRQIPQAHRRAESSVKLWKGLATWEVVEPSASDWEPPTPTGLLIRDTLSGHLHPRKATLAMAEAVRILGGTFDRPKAGIIIDATGWDGLKSLSAELDKAVGNGMKGQAALLRVDGAGDEQIFADTLHIVPHTDGTVCVGSTSEREFDDPTATDDQLDDIISRARALVPMLQNAPVIERWAGVRPRAKSRAPMMGRHPLNPDRFIVNGGFKIGFGMAPKMGEVMTDLVLDGMDRIPDEFQVAASL
ncbi:MAG: NAD(P)/FAD-dependent oxidoreductase [Planktomarina sp.]